MVYESRGSASALVTLRSKSLYSKAAKGKLSKKQFMRESLWDRVSEPERFSQWSAEASGL